MGPRALLLALVVTVSAAWCADRAHGDGVPSVLRNDAPRMTDTGEILDAHSGNIVRRPDGLFLMTGEHYGASTGFNTSTVPRLRTWSSRDLVTWHDEGPSIVDAPEGAFFTPWVAFNPATQQYVLWFNAYLHGCCAGDWGVAVSPNGTHFKLVSVHVEGAHGTNVDGNCLFVDDDGTGYVAYTAIDSSPNHMVSIEKLAPDFLSSTKENYGFFPDSYVEGASLWKRDGIYYMSYGSCCCFCRGGSGVVVFTATDIKGPWTRRGHDLNCGNTTTDVCGAYGARVAGDLTIAAQGISVSTLHTAGNGTVQLWSGERWLSAPHNNPSCPDECRPEAGVCAEPADYVKGHGFEYWVPLEYGADGEVLPFAPFVDEFTLVL